MNCRKRLAGVLCFAALLLACGVTDGALPPRLGAGAQAEAAQQRRRTRRVSKRRPAVPAKKNRVADGVWGGAHLRMDVGGDGASLEFDCAHGQIGAPFETDAAGRFDLPGTYMRQGPGPIRLGRMPTARPARYAGRVEGGRMTLTVKLEESDEPLGEFTLTRGDEGHVVKCR